MHQHEGIIVIAYVEGAPASEAEALLAINDLDEEFTTRVVAPDGQQGVAAKVNLWQEAEDLAGDVNGCARVEAFIHTNQGWVTAE